MQSIVVVGASLAGLRAAETLRGDGFDGRLVVIGAEERLPYDRPPLSKDVLAGKRDPESIQLGDEALYEKLEIDWRLGRSATGLDASARSVELDGGERITFDGLVIATGASPRRLPGTPEMEGIHVLRTLDDCLAIRNALDSSPRVAIVGAGFIGSEVAATCRGLGLDVALIEALPVPLATALGAEMGAALSQIHRDNGVDLRCGVGVDAFEGGKRVERIRLADGSGVDADLVVVGVGVAPATGWLEGSGLDVSNGVVCDETCSTVVPGIVAAGDVARWYNPLFGELMRVEHWTNAVDQGVAAAHRLLVGDGVAEPFAPVPYFWSDQYGAKIQFVGRARPDDEVTIAHGSVADRQFVALYGRAGRLVGALGMNRPRILMDCRRMLTEPTGIEQALERLATL